MKKTNKFKFIFLLIACGLSSSSAFAYDPTQELVDLICRFNFRATPSTLPRIQKLIRHPRIDLNKKLTPTGSFLSVKATPLIFAIGGGGCVTTGPSSEIVNSLIRNHADMNLFAEPIRKTALMFALEQQNYQIAEKLIGAGAKLNLQDAEGKTVLMYAIRDLPLMISSYYWNAPAGHQAMGGPFYDFSEAGNRKLKLIQAMLKQKPNVNLQDNLGQTALIHVFNSIEVDVVYRRLRVTADSWQFYWTHSGAFDETGNDPFGIMPQVADGLLAAGADTSIRDSKGRSAGDKCTPEGHWAPICLKL